MKSCRLGFLCLCLCFSLLSGLSAQSVRSSSLSGYLDVDGDFLATYSLGHLQRLVDGLVKHYESLSPFSSESERKAWQEQVGLAEDVVKELGLRQVTSIGVSAKTAGSDNHLYRFFVGVGPDASGCLLNTSCLSESKFVLFDRLPKDTLLAVELNLNLSAVLSECKASLDRLSKNHEMPSDILKFPDMLERNFKEEFGVELAPVLKASQGVCAAGILRTGSGYGICVSLPDSDGTVLALLKSKRLVTNDMKLARMPFVVNGGKVVASSGRLTFYSSPAVESAMTGGFREHLRERGYLGDFDGRGVHYFYLKSLVQLAGFCQGESNPVALGGDDPELFGYGQRTTDGLASTLRSNIPFMHFVTKLVMGSLSAARDKARQISCVSNLKQIGLGINMYALDHDDCYPREAGVAGLSKLKEYVGDAAVFICPNDRDVWEAKGQLTSHNCSYIYLGGVNMSQVRNPSDYPVVFERLKNHRNGVNILFGDGHVESVKTNDLERTIRSYLDRSGVSYSLKQRLLRELRYQLR